MEDLLNFFRYSFLEFTVRDAIDIIIISVLIYQLLKFTRKTRASQVIKGFGVLLVVSRITEFLQLQGITWILNYILTSSPIVLVIMFQPEFRRALEHIGRSRIFNKKSMPYDDTPRIVNEIVTAALNMSKRRIGALIVLEQSTGLLEHIRTGTLINGMVSAPLIENIFEPNTPLHDGAIIIRDETIVAASCFLPLSDNQAISRALGTRHRAALGVSEVSDAVTLVVSEETGSISVARDGKLMRNLDARTITEMLIKIYRERQENPFPFKLNLLKKRAKT